VVIETDDCCNAACQTALQHANCFVLPNSLLHTNFRACCAAGSITTLLAVSQSCWRYHHAAGGITTLLTVSPRCWRYHHATDGITTLLAVSPRF